ncbi:MAG TPA: PDZ domain-containing protein [Candidatus Parabacteroides intestinigallinarum]|uniref:Tricorn protease homolog n=1 Tax=Candidatus Parabacteroides intestinigallinarum TaxID=2838722 RepID=A0A9D1XS26_9BACT|nr:PDZ domain-containing protein [Candidatus Parabacteroides intestinigallinarum]
MKNVLIPALALCLSAATQAADNPLWTRYCAISPDGQTIAFSYQGDIYTVPTSGGQARQLTTHPAHDTRPVWSPDGQKLAFASNREGNFDIFLMDKEGGVPQRLTTHSKDEFPTTFKDNEHILFLANILQDARTIQFPGSRFMQVYEVDTQGGRPRLYSSLYMENIAFDPAGKRMLYNDYKGYEDPWRKHHQSAITRDIWLRSDDQSFRKVTDFGGEDRNPVWAPDGTSFYYLSEENGSFNIFKKDLEGGASKAITTHKTHPVRHLTAATNGTLCYSYNGEIYTVKEGGLPVKVPIQIVTDQIENDVIHRLLTTGATDIAVSPNGKEVAFIVHGDVYTTSIEYETTRQITNTPQQERDLDFSPDGRSLVYSAEREGTWGIYESKLTRDEDKLFTYAPEIKEEPLVVSGQTSFQPLYSPDGNEVAFLENRTTLRVINRKSKQVRTVLDGKYLYSYSDGDQHFQWSPDSRWFLVDYIAVGGWNNSDIALVKADGSGEVTNLTESGYSDGNAKWVLDGKAMIWSSDRAGYRSHGSWGAHRDVYIMFFDGEAYDKFRLSKEELALIEEEEEEDKDAEKEKDKAGKEEATKTVEPLRFDLANREDRVMRLTTNSSALGDAVLSAKGDKLYYCAAFEKGYDLWVHDLKDKSTKLLLKDVGRGTLLADKEVENLYLTAQGKLKKIDLKDNKEEPITFKAEFTYRPAEEREYIFHHAWRQVLDKFYDPTLRGIDWKGYEAAYARFLPHINNNFDFQEMLSELLGELNGSHTGARYNPGLKSPETACLGAFFDNAYAGDGLKIEEIIAKGPLTLADSRIRKGCVIEKIDGTPIQKDKDYYPLLAGKVGKKVTLSVYDPASGQRFEEQIKTIGNGEQAELLYKRWIKQCEETVDKLSDGQIGYVHVRGMNSESFRKVYSAVLGRCRNKKAVIVDIRHNGGGWLHDDLATLLSGKEYQRFEPRGQYIGSDPYNKWTKPSCVLMCEDDYSNAHGFPWVYKTLGIGKLIGTPVAGTMTAVWWETQIDPTLVFGIPQVGVKDMNGNYLENQQLEPDIEVYNTPEDIIDGEDTQLRRAVEEMLRTIKQ